jgi:hypothetical protein
VGLLRALATCLLLAFCAGCASTARLYNLDTGAIIHATFENYGTGQGKILATAEDGKTLQGEYSTISGASFSTGSGFASAAGTGGYAWASAQGFSFNQPGQQYGSAVVAGGGLVIEIIYAVEPWTSHGNGVGKDNKGGRYRRQF